MTYSPVPTGTLGDSISDVYWNTYIRDNFAALWPYLSAGDLAYLSAANTLSVLSKPSATSVLTSNAGVHAWSLSKNLSGHLNAKGTADFANTQTINTSTWTDLTGSSINLTTTTTCTIKILASVVGYNATTGDTFWMRGFITSEDSNGTYFYNIGSTSEPRNEALPYIYYATGIPSGTITVKLQGRNGNTGHQNVYTQGRIIALAFAE